MEIEKYDWLTFKSEPEPVGPKIFLKSFMCLEMCNNVSILVVYSYLTSLFGEFDPVKLLTCIFCVGSVGPFMPRRILCVCVYV